MAGQHWISGFRPDVLRELRRAAGLSQEGLAARIVTVGGRADGDLRAAAGAVNVERIKILQYEKGERVPRATALHALAGALGVKVTALLDPELERSLAFLRAVAGLTQADVAATFGLSRTTYVAIENGETAIDPALVPRLAAMLDVDVDELSRLVRVRR